MVMPSSPTLKGAFIVSVTSMIVENMALLYSKRKRKIVSSGFLCMPRGLFSMTTFFSSMRPLKGARICLHCSRERSFLHVMLSIRYCLLDARCWRDGSNKARRIAFKGVSDATIALIEWVLALGIIETIIGKPCSA